jgi:hypothetical protein
VADSGCPEYQRQQAMQAGSPASRDEDLDEFRMEQELRVTRKRIRIVLILVAVLSLLNILLTVYDFYHSPDDGPAGPAAADNLHASLPAGQQSKGIHRY